MSDKMLLIKGKGGLGNRMLSAVTGLVFADLTGRTPVIDWRDGSYAPIGENAYPILFDTPITRKVEEFDAWTGPVSPAVWMGQLRLTPQEMLEKSGVKNQADPFLYRKSCTDLSRLDASEDVAVFWSYLPKFGRLAGHLRRDSRFRGRKIEDIVSEYLNRYFTPNASVRNEVEAVVACLGRPLIGVHIRYTDLKIPLDKIKQTLRKRLAEKPGASIFLATDNAQVQAEMLAEFPNFAHTQKYLTPDGSRLHWPTSDVAKVQEAENALIDMWLLSRADQLIYSRQSTFSITSAFLGRLKPGQLDDVDGRNLKIVAKRIFQDYA